MAKWTFVAALSAAIGVVVGIAGLALIRSTLMETKRAVEVAERTLVATQRPWASVDLEIAGPFMFDEHGGNIRITFKMKNYGLSPALNVHVLPEIVPFFQDVFGKLKELTEFSKDLNSPRLVGDRIFPSEEHIVTKNVHIPRSRIKEAAAKKEERNDSFMHATIIGNVTYLSTLDEENHVTEFVFRIARKIEGKPNATLPIPTAIGRVQRHELRLERFLGSGTAD